MDIPDGTDRSATVSTERQREPIDVGLEMGYYDQRRAATHEEIAAELGCAPNTASEHLQKGEAKLIRSGIDTVTTSF